MLRLRKRGARTRRRRRDAEAPPGTEQKPEPARARQATRTRLSRGRPSRRHGSFEVGDLTAARQRQEQSFDQRKGDNDKQKAADQRKGDNDKQKAADQRKGDNDKQKAADQRKGDNDKQKAADQRKGDNDKQKAADQRKGDNDKQKSTQGPDQKQEGRGQISEEKRSGVRDRLRKEGGRVDRVNRTNINVSINVGSRIPRSVRLHAPCHDRVLCSRVPGLQLHPAGR